MNLTTENMTPNQRITIAVLGLIALIFLGFFIYQSDFAFRLRTQVATDVTTEEVANLQCSPTLDLAPGVYHLPVIATDEHGATARDVIEVNVVAPSPTPDPNPFSAYCGDGEVNQDWEECDGGNNCQDTCQIPTDQCTAKAFARVVVTDAQFRGPSTTPESTFYGENIFLGAADNHIPAGTWFPIFLNDEYLVDPDVESANYEDVPGLAVERQAGRLRLSLHGSHVHNADNRPREHVRGFIEVSNTQFIGQTNDASSNNPLENPTDGIRRIQAGHDEVSINSSEPTRSNFWMTVTTADDSFYSNYGDTPSCPIPQAPTLTLLGDNPLTVQVNDPFVDPGATAEDDIDGDITSQIVVGGDTVDTSTIGDYLISYNVTNSAGLSAPEVFRIVKVISACADGLDNDGDGAIDNADSTCHTDGNPDNPNSYDPTINNEGGPNPTECQDSVDNDNDGFIDGGDPSCHTDGDANNPASYDPNIDQEAPLPECGDGIDNDGDNFSDSADSSCHTDFNPLNPASYDPNRSEDTIGVVHTQCTDSVDNDGDGGIDGGDAECHTDGNPDNPDSYDPSITSELPPNPIPRCSDGIDNDGDGYTDIDDTQCHTDSNPLNPNSYDPNINDENGPNAQCSDSVDNDNDGLIDGGDDNCHAGDDPNNPSDYDPYDDTESDLDDDDDDDDDNDDGDDNDDDDEEDSDNNFRFDAENGDGENSGTVNDGGRNVILLAHERAFVDQPVSVPNSDYWLFINAKHDVPGPVDVGVYINGWPWKAIRLGQNDNQYRTHAVGKLRNFAGATIRFRFLDDEFTDNGNPEDDRNLYIDWWTLSESPNNPTAPLRGVGGGVLTSNGKHIMPRLNQIIREELGPQHVNLDIWQYYANRISLNPTHSAAVNSELRLRQIMRYWLATNPSRPRGI